ncbi:Hpt domain-containing protein [Pelagibacterium halotolerans]|uniref:Hpt domain-containing protein n=1 Tax=Pelagibacterium halotolerans TaxID=531813 RepID=UPI00384E5727
MPQPRELEIRPEGRVDRTSRPIDLVHLARQTLGDKALECEVLRMFDRQVNLYFERVRATTDPDELAMGLHTLKGASVGIGAVSLAGVARAAEVELRETGALDAETLDDMAMAVAEVSAYIQSIVTN